MGDVRRLEDEETKLTVSFETLGIECVLLTIVSTVAL